MRTRRQKVICILATCLSCASLFFIPVSVSAAETITQEDIFTFTDIDWFSRYFYFVFADEEYTLRDKVEDSTLSQLIDETNLYWETEAQYGEYFGFDWNGFAFDGNPARDFYKKYTYCFGLQVGSVDSLNFDLNYNRITYANIDFLVDNLEPTYLRFTIRSGHNSSAGQVVYASPFIETGIYSMIDQGQYDEFLVRSINDGLSSYDIKRIDSTFAEVATSGDLYLELYFDDFIPVQKFDHYQISMLHRSFINFYQYVDYWHNSNADDLDTQYVPPAFVNPMYVRPDNKPVEDESTLVGTVEQSFSTSLDNWDRLSDEFIANFGRFRLAMTTVGTLMGWCSGLPYFNFVVTFSLTLGIISFFLGMTNMIGKFF